MVSIIKKLLLAILGLLVAIVVFLLISYNRAYQPTPGLAPVKDMPKVGQAIPVPQKPVLLPVPKTLDWAPAGVFAWPASPGVKAPAEDLEAITGICANRLGIQAGATGAHLLFTKNDQLPAQAYRLKVEPARISIAYGDLQGAFYAATTLRQMMLQAKEKRLPCVSIEDQPDLKTRGAMLDISRGKVPTLATLFEMVDFLADLKYNHLQLYIEGFSFGYPSFKDLWEATETPITPEEIRQLDAYCKARFIELVPNQNSLGHMQEWLKQAEYQDLAECPEGYKLLGLLEMKTTLSPTDPRSLLLVKRMSEDLLPNFSSTQFNVNLDEPFELGKSKKRPINDPKAIARLYLDYAKQLNEYVNSKGKTMLMWGDVVSRTPEIINEIPNNITLLEWRYESFQPFDEICRQYQQAGLNYMVCPGTSTWSSFTGRTDNMLGNIENAVSGAVQYGAEGMLLTDWGDTPHLQYLTVSFAGLAYGAALSWNVGSKGQAPLEAYLSHVVFRDTTGQMGPLVLDMGRYNQFEEFPMMAMTTTSLAQRLGMMDNVVLKAIEQKMRSGITELAATDADTKNHIVRMFEHAGRYRANAIIAYVDSLEKHLARVQLNRSDASLIISEYANALRMVKLGAYLKFYNDYQLQQTDEQNRQTLLTMQALCADILAQHEPLWMQRNKKSGYEGSVESFKKLEKDVQKRLDLLNKNKASRWLQRKMDQMISAAAALYLS